MLQRAVTLLPACCLLPGHWNLPKSGLVDVQSTQRPSNNAPVEACHILDTLVVLCPQGALPEDAVREVLAVGVDGADDGRRIVLQACAKTPATTVSQSG